MLSQRDTCSAYYLDVIGNLVNKQQSIGHVLVSIAVYNIAVTVGRQADDVFGTRTSAEPNVVGGRHTPSAQASKFGETPFWVRIGQRRPGIHGANRAIGKSSY
jgi:hypothetical protein